MPFAGPASTLRRPGTGIRIVLFIAAAAGGALLLSVAFPPGARDRLPVLAISIVLALVAARRQESAVVSFAFLFPCAGLLARLFGGTEPLAWPLILFAGLAAGWSFRFIYDFERTADPSRWDRLLRALLSIWILSAAVALVRARTLWALTEGLTGRAVNGAGLPESTAIRETLLTVGVLASGAGFFFLLRRSGARVRRSALTAALAGVSFSAFAAILQRVGILAGEARAFWKITGRLSGGAMDPNSLGLLCSMGIVVLGALWMRDGSRRAAVIPGLLLLLTGLVLSGSRSGLIVPLVGLPAVLLLRRRGTGLPAAAFGLGLGALVLVLLWVAPRSGTVAGRLAQTFDPSLPLQYRMSERPVLWRSAGRLFLRSPLEGGGLGAFSWTLPDLLREEDRRLPMRDNPGSAYVQALAETGLVGFALTILLAVSLARQAATRLVATESDGPAFGAAGAALGFLLAQLLGSHWLAPDVCLFFFLLASLVALPAAARPSRASRLLLAGAVVLYAAASVAAAVRTATPDATFRHDRLAGFHPQETGPGGAFRWTRRRFAVRVAAGESLTLRLAYYPPDDLPVVVESRDGGRVSWSRTLQPGESVLLRLAAPASRSRTVVFRLSRTFVPKRLGISGDRRELGLKAIFPG